MIDRPNSESILDRPVEQRRREFKYRCAQALIFGVPVLVLQYFGRSLGGSMHESSRWVSLFQALLAGWVVYVAATGMLVEWLIAPSRRVAGDFCVAAVTILLYCYSLISTLGILFIARPFYQPLLFHWAVVLIAGWCGFRWWNLR